MSLDIMAPTDPTPGEAVVVMVTGFSAAPKDKGIAVTVDGVPPKVDILFDQSRAKLTLSIPTEKSTRVIRISVDDPNGIDSIATHIRVAL